MQRILNSPLSDYIADGKQGGHSNAAAARFAVTPLPEKKKRGKRGGVGRKRSRRAGQTAAATLKVCASLPLGAFARRRRKRGGRKHCREQPTTEEMSAPVRRRTGRAARNSGRKRSRRPERCQSSTRDDDEQKKKKAREARFQTLDAAASGQQLAASSGAGVEAMQLEPQPAAAQAASADRQAPRAPPASPPPGDVVSLSVSGCSDGMWLERFRLYQALVPQDGSTDRTFATTAPIDATGSVEAVPPADAHEGRSHAEAAAGPPAGSPPVPVPASLLVPAQESNGEDTIASRDPYQVEATLESPSAAPPSAKEATEVEHKMPYPCALFNF